MSILQIPGYEILNEIGVGGMSRVYLAYDPEHQRQVAIKLLPSEYLNDLGFRARFEQEASLIAGLNHEAIVPMYEYGVVQSQPFFVMPYLSHSSLADRLRRGPLAPDQAGQVLGRLGSALDYAHLQGIVHRDLKTSNILFDEGDNAFLADFGIALRAASAWQRHLASGTPAYMSPEQALRKGAVDARSDVYSLGIITFEMLTGRLPFAGDTSTSILIKQVHEPPPALGAVNPALPVTLDPLLQRALAKDPDDRYPTAREFAEAFQGAILQSSDQPPAAESQATGSPSQELRGQGSEPALLPVLAHPPAPDQSQTRPEFSKFGGAFVFSPDGKSRHHSKRNEGYHFYTLGLAIWLTVLLAAFTAVLTRAEVLFPSSNVRLIYNGPAVALINPSYSPVDLSGVVFQRLSDQGTVTASFSAEQWDRVNPGALQSLAAGDCFQLVRFQSNKLKLTAGEAPAKPATCDVSQGWLVAPDRHSLFWTPDGDGTRFRVMRDEAVIHECQIADGTCDFYLSPKE